MTKDAPINWTNTLFILLTPLGALIGALLIIPRYGVHWSDLLVFLVASSWAGLSITAGYHRLFSHRAYEAHWSYRLFHLLGGASAFEGSALNWSSEHRAHHAEVDTEADPYAITKGFFFAHMGWLFHHRWPDVDRVHRDLRDDPLIMWQHRNFVWLAISLAFVLPLLIGLPFGRALPFLLWGGLIRVVTLHHSTWLINSAAHVWGKQPYGTQDTSRDSWWLAYFTLGEGYHNFHHAFQADYRNGLRWWQVDPTKWWIMACSWVGLTGSLRRTAPAAIERSKLNAQRECLHGRFDAHAEHAESWKERLAEGRARLDEALHAWADAHRRYRRERKEARQARTEAWREEWKQAKAALVERIQAAREELGAQRAAYVMLVRGLRRETRTSAAA